jgi:hypothetical protein
MTAAWRKTTTPMPAPSPKVRQGNQRDSSSSRPWPTRLSGEEITPQMENIDLGQPEQIIPSARHHAPGEAG